MTPNRSAACVSFTNALSLQENPDLCGSLSSLISLSKTPVISSQIPRNFFLDAPDVVARALLGKLLIRRLMGEDLICRITETEAYFGSGDRAAHSFAGRTKRTEVLFGPPGHAYVYLIYGMHFCLNISCEPNGQAGCVLLRSGEPILGHGIMRQLRGLPCGAKPSLYMSGPGRLCQALGISRAEQNGQDVTDPSSVLRVCGDDSPTPPITMTTRIGITKDSDRAARFYIGGNACVSKAPSSAR